MSAIEDEACCLTLGFRSPQKSVPSSVAITVNPIFRPLQRENSLQAEDCKKFVLNLFSRSVRRFFSESTRCKNYFGLSKIARIALRYSGLGVLQYSLALLALFLHPPCRTRTSAVVNELRHHLHRQQRDC